MAGVRLTWNCSFLTGRYFVIAFPNGVYATKIEISVGRKPTRYRTPALHGFTKQMRCCEGDNEFASGHVREARFPVAKIVRKGDLWRLQPSGNRGMSCFDMATGREAKCHIK
jgi:hypothetical protein